MHSIRDIAVQAVAHTSTDPMGGLSLDEVYQLLDVCKYRPQQNEHLANPLNRDPSVPYFRPRIEHLSGTEPVYGQYLSLTYCAHDQFIILEDHENLASLESIILSRGGIVNPFTTFQLAFIDFHVARYQITYRSRDGIVKLFDKQEQYDAKVTIREVYHESKLTWLGGTASRTR